jgi:hypothetical protein
MTATQPVRQTLNTTPENEGDIEALREEAKELGINSFGLSRNALRASIAAVKKALENQPQPQPQPVTDTEADPGEIRADALGEALGPNSIKRIPMGTRATRLPTEQRAGYYRRSFNDVPGRIERARRAGYEHVKDPTGAPVSTPVGTHEHGGGMRAYFMEIPQELREQDLAQKRTINDDIDKVLNRGKVSETKEDRRYVPDTGISIKRR